jgi:hypothetical protein
MSSIKKPPDKYRVLKIPLSKIITKKLDFNILYDAADRTNKLIIHVYQFLELWILSKYHNKEIIPEITEDMLQMIFKALTMDSAGPKPKGTNKKYYDEFIKFNDNTYKTLGYTDKLTGVNLSQIIGYTTTSMLTCIENNIKLNFLNYIRKFVNCSFASQNKELLEKLKGKERVELNKLLKKELQYVKEDVINGTLISDQKYHKWINLHRPNIIPNDISKLSQIDINGEPQKFIKNMIYINLQLEHLEQKLYQTLPLRKSIIYQLIQKV